jgi:hypothetical protein
MEDYDFIVIVCCWQRGEEKEILGKEESEEDIFYWM